MRPLIAGLNAIFKNGWSIGPVCGPGVRSALSTAREALDRSAHLNSMRADGDVPPLKFGISLHVGEVVYGNVGTDRRLDFTVIGPAVNESARLEELTKSLNVPVVASARFADVSPPKIIQSR